MVTIENMFTISFEGIENAIKNQADEITRDTVSKLANYSKKHNSPLPKKEVCVREVAKIVDKDIENFLKALSLKLSGTRLVPPRNGKTELASLQVIPAYKDKQTQSFIMKNIQSSVESLFQQV